MREQTGSVTPRAVRRTRPPQLHGAAFEEFVRGHADATLDEMAQAWHEQGGARLTAMSFSRALRRLGWTPKKSWSYQQRDEAARMSFIKELEIKELELVVVSERVYVDETGCDDRL